MSLLLFALYFSLKLEKLKGDEGIKNRLIIKNLKYYC